jgi:hypothetical protein
MEKTEAGEIRNHSHRRLESHEISSVPHNIIRPRRRFGVLRYIVLQDTETILVYVVYTLCGKGERGRGFLTAPTSLFLTTAAN